MHYYILVLRFQSSSSSLAFLVSRSSFSVHRFSSLSSSFAFLVRRSQFDTTALLSQSIHTFFLPFSLSSVGSSFSLLFRSSVPRRLHVHLLLISGWVHLSRTHAGFRWCASFIGSVLTVPLSCRQVLALIVPSRLGFISGKACDELNSGEELDCVWCGLDCFLSSSLSSGLSTHCSFSYRSHL